MAATALLAKPLLYLLPTPACPCTGGIEPASIMDERQLVQNHLRLPAASAPEIELSLPRESPRFRDRVIPLAINNARRFFENAARWLCRQSPRAGTVLTARRSQTEALLPPLRVCSR